MSEEKRLQYLKKNYPEKYWFDKYPVIEKLYRGRTVPERRVFGFRMTRTCENDVRSFIRPTDLTVKRLLAKIFEKSLDDIKAMPISDIISIVQTWVINNITYIGDDKGWGTSEFWQYPDETMELMAGDCEDLSFVISSLLLAAGAEPWRVRVACGWVDDGQGGEGGHAYVTYCRGQDWVPIDWCFAPQVRPLDERAEINKRSEYHQVWFSMNNLYCWSHENIPMFSGRVKVGPVKVRRVS